MYSKQCLAILNYTLAFYTAFIAILGISTISDVKELIEVHHWHGCWQYRDFSTYVTREVVVLGVYAVAFLASWTLLRSTYWKLTGVVLGGAAVVAFSDFWLGLACWQ